MRPDRKTHPGYVEAFREIASRIAATLVDAPREALPIGMYVAGGAALHFYTGERVSKDVDAAFSRRIALPDDLEVAYRDLDGTARLIYLDRQYNDTLALMHEDAREDAVALSLKGIDARILDVRLLSPLDLAVSKLSRFSEQDREDIASLARHKRIKAAALRERAEQALGGYVGSTERVKGAINVAVQIVGEARG